MSRRDTTPEALADGMSDSRAGALIPYMEAASATRAWAAPSGRLFVGLLAQVVDTWVLHPIVIVAVIGMLLCWYGIPDEKRRSE
ncbi:hypothetical protein MY1884_000916 [Beauveria asiatica]